jgi:hypothetical protein
VRPYLKITESKGAGGVAQVAEDLPSKCKALSSNTGTIKRGWGEIEKKRKCHRGEKM